MKTFKRFYQNLFFMFIGMTISSIFMTQGPGWKFYLPIEIALMISIFLLGWSDVEDGPKPLKWWCHKFMCELGWLIRHILRSHKMYYYHLNKCCDAGFNLYGKKCR